MKFTTYNITGVESHVAYLSLAQTTPIFLAIWVNITVVAAATAAIAAASVAAAAAVVAAVVAAAAGPSVSGLLQTF